MKKDTLTKPNKKSIIWGRGALSFNKVFVTVSTAMRGLHKDCTKGWKRVFSRPLGYFEKLVGWKHPTFMTTKEKIMKAKKIVAWMVCGLFLVWLITGCGGGGGSSPTPTPTPATVACWNGTTASAVANCPVVTTPALVVGADNLPKITAAPGATVTSGTVTATAGSSTVVYAVQPNGTVTLTSGTQSYLTMYQYMLVVNYSNGPASVVAGTYTTAKLTYPKTIVGIRHGAPGLVNLTGGTVWVEAQNNTSFPPGTIYNGYASEGPLPDGQFLELVMAAKDGDLHIVSHNIVTNVLTDFIGVVPAGYEVARTGGSTWNIGAKWHNAPWGTSPQPYMLAWAKDSAGNTAYTEFVDNKILNELDANGIKSVRYTSTDGGVFSVLVSVESK